MAIGAKASTKGFGDARYRAVIEQLVAERKRQKLSQIALGKRLGRHQQFVSRYETGERRLDVVEFVDVAHGLGLDPQLLLGQISRSLT